MTFHSITYRTNGELDNVRYLIQILLHESQMERHTRAITAYLSGNLITYAKRCTQIFNLLFIIWSTHNRFLSLLSWTIPNNLNVTQYWT